MKKSIIAGVTALSLVLSSASSAQAEGLDREDVGKLLFGLVAIAAVSAAIENNQGRSDRDDSTRVHSPRNGSWADLNRPRPRHDIERRVLPHDCLRTVETRFGSLRLFSERCLNRNYRFAADLPERCEVRVYSDRGPRDGYDPLCLREQGYRTNRRH